MPGATAECDGTLRPSRSSAGLRPASDTGLTPRNRGQRPRRSDGRHGLGSCAVDAFGRKARFSTPVRCGFGRIDPCHSRFVDGPAAASSLCHRRAAAALDSAAPARASPAPNRAGERMTTALSSFRGRAARRVGMGKALAEAFPRRRAGVRGGRRRARRRSSPRLMFEGPEAELTLTANAQPALMAVSLAACACWRPRRGSTRRDAAYVAGHSLGEYSALAAAGALHARRRGAAAAHARRRPCRRRCRSAQARWRRCSGSTSTPPRRSPRRRPQGEVCEAPTTTAAGQVVVSGAQGRGRARHRDRQGARAPGAPCCCRCPRRSIAR